MPIPVMISGLPGKVSLPVMSRIRQAEGLTLVEYGLKGTSYQGDDCEGVQLFPPERHRETLQRALDKYPTLVVADFTSPTAVNRNAELYCREGAYFIMGTTGGDRKRLLQTVKGSSVSAVIAPNMSKPLVAVTAAFEYLAREFPDALSGYAGHVKESHQQAKRDPSGTGKAWMQTLEGLGIGFDGMESVRNPAEQIKLGVPPEHLGGHGYHWVDINGSGVRVLVHTAVNGRETYAEGAVDAVKYLDGKRSKGSRSEVFSMVDVLRNR